MLIIMLIMIFSLVQISWSTTTNTQTMRRIRSSYKFDDACGFRDNQPDKSKDVVLRKRRPIYYSEEEGENDDDEEEEEEEDATSNSSASTSEMDEEEKKLKEMIASSSSSESIEAQQSSIEMGLDVVEDKEEEEEEEKKNHIETATATSTGTTLPLFVSNQFDTLKKKKKPATSRNTPTSLDADVRPIVAYVLLKPRWTLYHSPLNK